MYKFTFLLTLALATTAHAARPDTYFTSVTGTAPSARCNFLRAALTQARRSEPTFTCGAKNENESSLARASGTYRYHLVSEHHPDGSEKLSIENWSPDHDQTDFTELRWKIEPDAESGQRLQAEKLLARFVDYDRKVRVIKEGALLNGLATSDRVALGDDGDYVDKTTREPIAFEAAYTRYRDESPRHKHYLRAVLEIFGELGAGTVWYWRNLEFNAVDWELQWSWKDWRRKFILGDGVVMDSNLFDTNASSHPRAGALYYMFARTNNLNPLESFLFAVAASTVWEYLAEFKEKISINDMIATPVAGMAIGEVLYQLGGFFDRGAGTLVNKVLSAIFSSPRTLHHWIDRTRPRRDGNTDSFGFTRETFHEFQLFAGASAGARLSPRFGLETLLVNIPEYGKPGNVSALVADGNFSQAILELTRSEDQYSDFKLFMKAALAGYYEQRTRRGDDGQLQGYSFFVGAATAFEYAMHEREPGETRDFLGIVNVLGGALEVNYYRGGLRLKATVDVFGDFGMVRSYALDKWSAENGEEGISSVLAQQRYYYAFGVTLHPAVVAQYRAFEAGAQLSYDYFNSIDGYDRHQDQVTLEAHPTDTRRTSRAWLAYTLPNSRFKLKLTYESRERSGNIMDTSVSRRERRWLGDVIFVF